ncbi:hypothetical protein [Acidovorax sp.]
MAEAINRGWIAKKALRHRVPASCLNAMWGYRLTIWLGATY